MKAEILMLSTCCNAAFVAVAHPTKAMCNCEFTHVPETVFFFILLTQLWWKKYLFLPNLNSPPREYVEKRIT